MKNLLKVLWVLVSAWTAVVFFVGISGEWATMSYMTQLIVISAVFPTLATAAWTMPKSWRYGETGVVFIVIFGALSMFAVLGGWGLAATTDPYESPVCFVASVILIAHSALHAGLAVYTAEVSEKRRHQEWRQSNSMA